MHINGGVVACLFLLSAAAAVSAATSILNFQCPDTEVPVSPSDNAGDLTLSAGSSNKTYVLAAGTYTITNQITLAQDKTCYIAAEGASVTVIARFNGGWAWVLTQNATLGLQGFTL